MCTPFCSGERSTVQSISRPRSASRRPRSGGGSPSPRPVTPARDRPSRTSGVDAWRSCGSSRDSVTTQVSVSTARGRLRRQLPAARLARVPRPAHAARDRSRVRADAGPHGRPRRAASSSLHGDDRRAALSSPSCSTSSARGADRGRPLRARRSSRVDTLDFARGLRRSSSARSASRSGARARRSQVDVEAVQRGVAALAQAALRHGGLEQVELRVDGATHRDLAGHSPLRGRSCSERTCAISAPRSR